MSKGHFIVPIKIYASVFVALLFLTFITVYVSLFDFGDTMNFVIAMAIAFIKATLVAMFFMGLRWDSAFNSITLVSALACLGIFVALTFADIAFREDMNVHEATTFGIKSPVKLVEPSQAHHGESSHDDDGH